VSGKDNLPAYGAVKDTVLSDTPYKLQAARVGDELLRRLRD
jgi:hypothetical protein